MSALGDRLREFAANWQPARGEWAAGMAHALDRAAGMADEHEAAALAESAGGRGPHAAAAFRWLAAEFSNRTVRQDCETTAELMLRLADEAERAQGPTLAAFAAQGGGS